MIVELKEKEKRFVEELVFVKGKFNESRYEENKPTLDERFCRDCNEEAQKGNCALVDFLENHCVREKEKRFNELELDEDYER
ncbi:MAG: hypothetical protein KBS96_04575 [Lachnospiraceae bacterium]|nr:hypothetical protein [Candidatus Colinaster scatohippi]